METMVNQDRIEGILAKMRYEGLFTVAGTGHGGGLALLWRHVANIKIESSSQNFIDAEVKIDDINKWRLTCIYGFPERSRRRDSWDLLKSLAAISSLPWVILGDFHDLLREEEKKGRHKHPTWLLNVFRETVCGISDLPMEGYPYTWERSRGTERWVQEKLDRVFVNEGCKSLFPTNKVYNLIAPSSDHSAIFLQVSVWRPVARNYKFRFENCWLRESRCSDIVAESWRRTEGLNMEQRIEVCGFELKKWGDTLVKDFQKRLQRVRETLERFRGLYDAYSVQCLREAETEYAKILVQKEDFWKQRVKQFWLKEGDSNSKYFHSYASARKKKNHINQLKNSEGSWVNWASGLGNVIEDYYSDLFASRGVRADEVLDCIGERVTGLRMRS
ncbi:uncharacterized protein LOC141679451 [Apium graveolens]|uniref:uncharacterized protein LOC141679451 n=1 Tax=Apium graveolens TaxID=4045 RepID=UPI003D7B2802